MCLTSEQALIKIIAQRQKLFSLSDISQALGKSRTYAYGIELSDEQITTLENKFEVVLRDNLNMTDSVPIEYFYHPNLGDIVKSPYLTNFSYDREILKKWNVKKEDVRIVRMLGDTMDGGERPVQNEDVIIIDITSKNPMFSGVYAYTTDDYKSFFISGIRQLPDNSLEFYYHNSNFKSVTYTKEQLKEMDFQIIGRMIKNVTFKM